MKVHLDCVICQQRQALRVLRLATDDQYVQERILRQVMAHLLKAEWTADPMTIAKAMSQEEGQKFWALEREHCRG